MESMSRLLWHLPNVIHWHWLPPAGHFALPQTNCPGTAEEMTNSPRHWSFLWSPQVPIQSRISSIELTKPASMEAAPQIPRAPQDRLPGSWWRTPQDILRSPVLPQQFRGFWWTEGKPHNIRQVVSEPIQL